MRVKELLERIVAISKIASKDHTRYHLNGVHVSKVSEGVRIACTDGHRLIIETFEDVEIEGIGHGFLIGLNEIKLLKGYLGSFVGSVLLEYEGGTLKMSDEDRILTIKVDEQVKYPQVETLVPKQKEVKKIAFNVEYLKQIFDALKESNRSKIVELHFELDENGICKSPMIVKTQGREAVLMPYRI